MLPDDAPRARERALAETVVDVERQAARRGWDAPLSLFALVRTAPARTRDPGLSDVLPESVLRAAAGDPEHLTAVEQEALPAGDTLEDVLAHLSWPATVDGAAVVVERLVVPPEVERGLPADPAAALAVLAAHPARTDVRIVVGVLRSGESWCTLRARSHDSDDAVAGSRDAVPGLVEALRSTLD